MGHTLLEQAMRQYLAALKIINNNSDYYLISTIGQLHPYPEFRPVRQSS